jgi:alpha-N-arabinofuranosidase
MKRLAFAILLFAAFTAILPATAQENKLVIGADQGRHTISKHIYGHFSEHLGRCIYEGIWVGEDSPIPNTRGIRNDVVAALKKIKVPNLRWPGGCFADEYHWKDGIGPRAQRPKIINTHWGGVVENNHFGTHEFMDLCEQLGTDPVVCGNVGSGTVQEMMEWVEYMTSDADSPMANLRRKNGRDKPWKLPFFAVGNENWGCGGNMRPEYYADVYRRYNTFIKNYSGNRVYRVACGASDGDVNWTEVLMANAARHMNGLSLHHYSLPTGSWSGSKGSSTRFDEKEWFAVVKHGQIMDELVRKHLEVMDKHDRQKRVGLVVDEWGAWYDVEPGTNPGFLYQQSTMRDAVLAAATLNVFNNHADRVKMANIAQIINVLQSVILTDKEKMLLTPTYHVFHMYKPFRGARQLPVELAAPALLRGDLTVPTVTASAARDAEGRLHYALVNLDPRAPVSVQIKVTGGMPKKLSGMILTANAMDAINTFDQPDNVKPAAFNGARVSDGVLRVEIPAKAIVVLSEAGK